MGIHNAGSRPKRRAGFSIIELMIVLLLAGAILAIGAPSFGDFRRNNRLTAAANDFVAALQLARTEAIKRQRPVALCPSSSANTPNANCNAGDFIGWIAFEDRNGDCLRSVDEPILRGAGPLEVTVANNADGSCVIFTPTGFTQRTTPRPALNRVIFCDDRGLALQSGTNQSAARGIQIAPGGRPQVLRDPTLLTSWELACQTS